MIFNIITNMDEGCGLRQDHDILRELITKRGHTVQSRDFRNTASCLADVNIFLEVQVPQLFSSAKQNWLVPNPEWFLGNASSFDLILCKTLHAEKIFQRETDRSRVRYVGFESRDMFWPSFPKTRNTRFLHVAGKSDMKNTEAILSAWLNFGIPYPLTLVTSLEKFAAIARSIPNVTHHYHLSNSDLGLTMNSHTFHLCPSKTEGWGHYIHEALSAGAIVLTTDAAPMNEIHGAWPMLPSRVEGKLRLSDINVVCAQAINTTVQWAASLSADEIDWRKENARECFLDHREVFRNQFNRVLDEAEC